MPHDNLTESEARFAELIWSREPVSSGELVKLCESKWSWKKSTTYTMLKRLESKHIFKNADGIVSSLIQKDDYYAEQGRRLVDEAFGGSLPRFFAAFARNRKLSEREINEVMQMIRDHKEE